MRTPIASTVVILWLATLARADIFGNDANRFEIDFVTIGAPGNASDASPSNNLPPTGHVDVFYGMAKFEISRDLVDVFISGKFETGETANWSEGDSDGDGVFGTRDLVLAFEQGAYEQGPRRATAAVPEPWGSFSTNIMPIAVAIGRSASGRRTTRPAASIARTET